MKREERLRISNHHQSEPVVPHVQIQVNCVPSMKAAFAADLIKGGFYTGKPGKCRERYQELELIAPKEVVARACDMAEAMYAEFDARGWLMPIPWHDEMVEQLRGTSTEVGFRKSSLVEKI